MRRFLSILFILASFTATAQTVQTIGAPGTRVVSRGDFITDSILYLPRTQVASRAPFQSGAIRYQASDSTIYQWTGTAWRKLTADIDTNKLSTRAWRQKGDDSVVALVAAKVNISDTATMLSPYVRAAGFGLTKGTQTLSVDSVTMATRARVQKGIDSVANLSRVTGSGTTNYVAKFTSGSAVGNSAIFDNDTDIGFNTTTTDPFARNDDRRYNFDATAISSTANIGLSLNAGASAGRGAQIYLGTGGTRVYDIGVNANESTLGTVTNTPFIFKTNNTNRMRLTGPGELLINGTTDNGDYHIQLTGGFYNTAGVDMAVTSGEVNIGKTLGADSGFFKLQVNGNMYMNRTNRIQIGRPDDTTRAISIGAGEFEVSVNLEEYHNGNSGPDLFIGRGRGTIWSKQNIDSGTVIGAVEWRSYLTSQMRSSAIILARTSKVDAGNNIAAADLIFRQPFTTSSAVDNFTIFADGGNAELRGKFKSSSLETSAPSGGSVKPWKLGEVATVSPTSPNRTIRVEIDGVVYYIHAKTTND